MMANLHGRVDVETLVRLKVTAARAMETSLDSYQRLIAAAAIYRPDATDRSPDGSDGRDEGNRTIFFAAISNEVARLTVSIAEELLFLCNLSIAAGVMRGDVRQKLAQVINDEQRPGSGAINLRQQRIRRLPAQEGLHLVMDSLQTMCDQVDSLIGSLSAGGAAGRY